VVLFGGDNSNILGDTWTWDGTTWTKQHAAAGPTPRFGAAMAYDAATGTVVLFGGCCTLTSQFGDTWTWDGTTWTKQHPAASPTARDSAAMAYDAATGTVALFGGEPHSGHPFGDTWTWG
jgi:Galactose oxidase, central domain